MKSWRLEGEANLTERRIKMAKALLWSYPRSEASMGDFQNEKVGAEQDDLQNRDAQATVAEYPATTEVRSRLASGAPNASAIAMILHEHPRARNEIMALIHKMRGNGFAQEVAAENVRILRAEADGGPGIKEGKTPDKKTVEETTAAVFETDAPSPSVAAPMAEAASGAPGSQPAPASPSKSTTDAATAEVLKDDPLNRPNQSAKDREATTGIMDFEAAPNNEHEPASAPSNAEAPVEASRVLKDETVIGGSSEIKQPEIVRASEVLKDPAEAESPAKASDVDKDDDAENEGSSGGAKAEAGPVKITASVLRVRSSPKISNGNIVGRLTRDTVVEAIGHSGDWVEIKFKGQTAFVHSSFVVGAQEAAVPKASDATAVASAPS